MSDSALSTSQTRSSAAAFRRRLPVGAEVIDSRTAHVRVWAPLATRVRVVLDGGGEFPLTREADGYFSGTIDAAVGGRYRFRLNDDERAYPDPASRFQPEGPHGASAI